MLNPTTCTLTEWLDFTDAFLCHNPAAGKAWDIMTALRGPDTEEHYLKSYTIGVRRRAFPRLTSLYDLTYRHPYTAGVFGCASFNAEDCIYTRPSGERSLGLNPHFTHHIHSALNALDAGRPDEDNS